MNLRLLLLLLRGQEVPLFTRPAASKMSSLDVDEFLQQNRAVSQQVETYRGYWESDKHWLARREFILRNINDFQPPQLDQLLSLSMVWSNNVFLGCRCVNKTKRTSRVLAVKSNAFFWDKYCGFVLREFLKEPATH